MNPIAMAREVVAHSAHTVPTRRTGGHDTATDSGNDPVVDLRNGWDTHVGFARSHPAVYRLMFSPSFATVPSAAEEAMRLLRAVLDRCAAAGRLRVESARTT